MRRILIAAGVLVSTALVVVGIGYALPVAHTANRYIVLRAAPGDVWAAITDVTAYPSWRADVDSVEVLPFANGQKAWRETGSNGVISYAAPVVEAPTRMVTRITDRDLPFGGSWELRLSPQGTGTRVTIIERGEVYDPLFRFVSRYIMGHSATIDAYLRALGTKFGERVEPATPGG